MRLRDSNDRTKLNLRGCGLKCEYADTYIPGRYTMSLSSTARLAQYKMSTVSLRNRLSGFDTMFRLCDNDRCLDFLKRFSHSQG